MAMFSPGRLRLARERASLLCKELAERCGVVAQTISNWESGNTLPGDEEVARAAAALGFPAEFMYLPDIEPLAEGAVSFRARTKLTARPKHAALAAGTLAIELGAWLEQQFDLPEVRLPDLRGHTPELAAEVIRADWGIGDRPIPNMLHALESHGVLVFSLTQDVKELDAFSFWAGRRPIVLLNTMKSAERSRFDAAHELMHLLCHHEQTDRRDEEAADKFAGALLMPKGGMLRHASAVHSLPTLIADKTRWRVSLAAYIYRLHDLEVLRPWHYRMLMVECSKRGYLREEPNALRERESSMLLRQVFEHLQPQGLRPAQLARKLRWPRTVLEELLFGLGAAMLPVTGGGAGQAGPAASLHLVGAGTETTQ